MEINELLGKYGVTIPSDQQDAFNSEFRSSYKSEQEYSKVRGQRDSYKGEIDTLNGQITTLNGNVSTLQTQNAQLTSEIDGYKQIDAIGKANISSQYSEYVRFEVNKMVSDDKDFETALGEYIDANPQYKEGEKVSVSTGGNFGGGQPRQKSSHDIMNDAILKGLGRRK